MNSVGTIFCVGRNYAEHAKELGNSVPTSPLIFLKPRGCVIASGDTLELPVVSQNVHHEIELVLRVGKACSAIDTQSALSIVDGYAIGIDVTARDIQDKLKEQRAPWTLSKGLPGFAPLGNFVPSIEFPATIELKINGKVRQTGSTNQMIFPLPYIVSYLANTYGLLPGDLIFTGTPAGVGPIEHGDYLEGSLLGYSEVKVWAYRK